MIIRISRHDRFEMTQSSFSPWGFETKIVSLAKEVL